METIYLSLGTNLGNRVENLKTALGLLKSAGVQVKKVSSVYETEPVGHKSQPDFYNICVESRTRLKPGELLKAVKHIEQEIGRVKEDKWGPRIIDIDILFYSNIILENIDLKIPHEAITGRKFVLEPLSEIAGDYIHPGRKISVKELLKEGNFPEKVSKIGALE